MFLVESKLPSLHELNEETERKKGHIDTIFHLAQEVVEMVDADESEEESDGRYAFASVASEVSYRKKRSGCIGVLRTPRLDPSALLEVKYNDVETHSETETFYSFTRTPDGDIVGFVSDPISLEEEGEFLHDITDEIPQGNDEIVAAIESLRKDQLHDVYKGIEAKQKETLRLASNNDLAELQELLEIAKGGSYREERLRRRGKLVRWLFRRK